MLFRSPMKESSSSKPDMNAEGASELDQELASTLQDMQLHHEPRKLSLPSSLWSGTQAIIDGDLIRLEKTAYNNLVHGETSDDLSVLTLRGGQVFANIDEDTKFAKVRLLYIMTIWYNFYSASL